MNIRVIDCRRFHGLTFVVSRDFMAPLYLCRSVDGPVRAENENSPPR